VDWNNFERDDPYPSTFDL